MSATYPEPASALATTLPPRRRGYFYLRHRWPVRLTHWVNVLSLSILLMWTYPDLTDTV